MTDLETAIEYYKELLLYQYINRDNARATIGLLVSQALVDLLPIEMGNAFNIDTAVGDQLDIIGEYIGFDRAVVGAVSRDYFTADDYVTPSATTFGFTDYSDPARNANAAFYSYLNNMNTTDLEDSEYRALLKLKAALNISNLSYYDIVSILGEAFGDLLVFSDSKDMTIWYLVSSQIERIVTIAYNEGLLPKPMGVQIGGIMSFADPSAIWGFSSYLVDNGATVGFSSYSAWADAEIADYQNNLI
jgi:hypothetical protein